MSSVDEDRNWLALRYVLGEMSDSERDAFEERMAGELAVCETVTAAGRLVLTARAALADPAVACAPAVVAADSHHIAKRSTRGSWLAIAAASVAVALVCLLNLPTPNRLATIPNRTDVASVDPSAAELVSLWRSGVSLGDDESEEAEESAELPGDVAVPGWMLAAVSFESPETIDGPSEKVRGN
jgi:anti-sigma-K factor RskA